MNSGTEHVGKGDSETGTCWKFYIANAANFEKVPSTTEQTSNDSDDNSERAEKGGQDAGMRQKLEIWDSADVSVEVSITETEPETLGISSVVVEQGRPDTISCLKLAVKDTPDPGKEPSSAETGSNCTSGDADQPSNGHVETRAEPESSICSGATDVNGTFGTDAEYKPSDFHTEAVEDDIDQLGDPGDFQFYAQELLISEDEPPWYVEMYNLETEGGYRKLPQTPAQRVAALFSYKGASFNGPEDTAAEPTPRQMTDELSEQGDNDAPATSGSSEKPAGLSEQEDDDAPAAPEIDVSVAIESLEGTDPALDIFDKQSWYNGSSLWR